MSKNKDFKKQDEPVEEPVPAPEEETMPEEPVEEISVEQRLEELQDIVAELTDVVTQLAEQVKSTAEIKEGIAESLKSMKDEIVKEFKEIIKENLKYPEDEDKKRQADWEKKPTDVKPSGEGEEVKVDESRIDDEQPGVKTLQEAMNVSKAERPVEVKKELNEGNDFADIVDAILKGEVRGFADLRKFRKV